MPIIQWFPGHMAEAKRELRKTLASVDAVVELIDARIPYASTNPLLEELRNERQRPVLKLLNKSDLADEKVTNEWLKFFSTESKKSIAISMNAKSKSRIGHVIDTCQKLAPHRDQSIKPLRIVITGVPNVGKSTLINSLIGQGKAKTADEPAVTRMISRYETKEGTVIYDSPGVMWPKIKTSETGLYLAAHNAIGVNAYDNDDVAIFLVERILVKYPDRLKTRYKLSSESKDSIACIEDIGRRLGLRSKGGGVDFSRTATFILTDYRHGRFGRMTLQNLEDL